MANDPDRDLLPVREDGCRGGKGFCDKFDHQILGKLSRCELEDRFLRLLDEQTHIKKLANSQEEKIKRLGTKLLRLINEKKTGKKHSDLTKETEELNLRIIELEHENYTLKDKNTVLKQQLSSHSRNISTHRSPISNHTSPLMTVRQCAPAAQSDSAYDMTQKHDPADIQLQEAEAHIRELNEEIKSLHNKIDYLQQNLEKTNLDSRKVKVSENIELIRLQRSLKQQAIQIASLQEQVKNSEKTQKILKEDLVKAHNENDEALHMISVKQNEILSLCSKLEETNLNRLEEDELKERINDLMLERDCLKERSDFLMKSIGAKSVESEKINELQKMLAEEKAKKEKLEEALELLRSNFKDSTTEIVETSRCEKIKTMFRGQQTTPEKKETNNFSCNTGEESDSSRSQESCNREIESDTECENRTTRITIKKECSDGKYVIERMKLELELQYLREMLRSQTLRCEAQQAEISRLMYELKLNEERCSETLQRLDWHLRIFESLEVRTNWPDYFQTPKVEPRPEQPAQPRMEPIVELEENQKPVSPGRKSSPSSSRESVPQTGLKEKNYTYKMRDSSEENYPSKLVSSNSNIPTVAEQDKKPVLADPKKRFVEQTFLESSEDDLLSTEKEAKRVDKDARDFERNRRFSAVKHPRSLKRKESSSSSLTKRMSDQPSKPYERDYKKDNPRRDDESQTVTISILWFKIKAESSFWKDDTVELFFFDFTFLDLNGAETETPQSLPKPRNADAKCEFNFTQAIDISGNRLKAFQKVLRNPDSNLFVFKLVSDSDKHDSTAECEDIGIAVMTTKDFFDFCNKGPFQIYVKNNSNIKEVIGILSVSVEATTTLLNLSR